jgi:two-component system, OmpR family, phosphate regulon response regulator PhoB
MTSANTIVLIVEDDPAIAELVKYSLREDSWVCRSVPDLDQAWDFVQRQAPQLVMLDWMLRNESGLRLLARMRADRELRAIPVILLTARTLDEDRSMGLGSGADDYVTKPFSPRELLARAKAALSRKVEDVPEPTRPLLQLGNLSLDPLSFTVRVGADKVELRQAEYRLLKFLLTNPGQVFTRAQLLDQVWEADGTLDLRTVDVHVLRLRKALGQASSLVKTVRSAGYMLTTA